MKKKYEFVSAVCLGGLLVTAAFPVHATDNITCSGTVATIGVHGTDRVFLRLSGMNTLVKICDLGQTLGTTYPITAEQCKVVYSTLLTGYSLGKTMNVVFDNVQTGTSCSNFASWELATARWVYLGD